MERIWIIGDIERSGWETRLAALGTALPLASYPTICAALAERKRSCAAAEPASILLLQSRPGEFAARGIESLRTAAPLARLIVLLGPWCEGEGRTGRPLTGVARVPWSSGLAGLRRALDRRSGNQSLPPTASETDAILQHAADLRGQQLRASALVASDNNKTWEGLSAALSALGIRAIRPADGDPNLLPPDFALADGWSEAAQLQGFPRPVILALHFPRPDDAARAQQIGISEVIALPLRLAELAETIRNLVPAAMTRSAAVA